MGKLSTFFKKANEEKEVRYILSIDGGGMRGLIPAYILSKLDEEVKKSGDERPLYSHFDLIAGTSTGALLALALTSKLDKTALKKDTLEPFEVFETKKKGLFRKEERVRKGYIVPSTDPSSLIDIYIRHGEKIFPHSALNMLSQLFQVKYDIRPFEDFLLSELGDIKFSSSLCPTLAIAYDCPNGRPYIFKSYEDHGFRSR